MAVKASAIHWNPKTSIGKVACGVQSRSFSIKTSEAINLVSCKNCLRSLIFRMARAGK